MTTSVDLFKQDGKKNGTIDLNDNVFGIKPNNGVITDVVLMQRAAMRQGTHSVKNRSAVSGGGKKPWRQKGTGRARQGSIRAPQWRGGGIVFGPTPRSYAYKLPHKVRQLAMRSALSQKVLDKSLKVIETLNFDKPKTADFKQILDALDMKKKTLVIVEDDNENAALSARNLANVTILPAKGVNVLDIVNNEAMLFTKAALTQVEEVFA